MKGFFNVPVPKNEPIWPYVPNSDQRKAIDAEYKKQLNANLDVPMYIGAERVFTQDKRKMSPPHDHQHVLGHYSYGTEEHVKMAINAALAAKKDWENMAWEHRAAIFLKAADLIATKYRIKTNVATMLAQSKNVFQSEIDAVCEFVDFLRYNVQYMTEIYSVQPESAPTMWNRMEYRPLEGFVFALTPFNFTSIAGNLPCAPALMGNTVVWKCADSQVFSAQLIMEILLEAGLPVGVINLVYCSGPVTGSVIFDHPDFAGIHFTGSTGVFQNIWKTIGNNISKYKSYPRIVGETGGKDFIWAHPSANPIAVATAISRGAFEFQGQKCSAASRAYIPSNLWETVKEHLLKEVGSFKMGSPEIAENFVNAVIDERAFDKISSYITDAKADPNVTILAGGNFDKSKGYFIEPTIILTKNPKSTTMCEEIFGPVITIYVYDEKEWKEILTTLDETSPYALTGAIFSQDRYAIEYASNALKNSAGNFYINDKPTGAVVGQQPFGGARASGTNDKAGSVLNLYRWVSPRAIKETFSPPEDYKYPFLG